MTDLKETLAQFRKLDAGRTDYKGYGWHAVGSNVHMQEEPGFLICELETKEDAEFVAHLANNALPALEQAMAEIERLRIAANESIEALSSASSSGKAYPHAVRHSIITLRKALSETTE